jgi:hypothetical protein
MMLVPVFGSWDYTLPCSNAALRLQHRVAISSAANPAKWMNRTGERVMIVAALARESVVMGALREDYCALDFDQGSLSAAW